MTTFDDTDLFTDAFRDFGGVGDARRRSGWLTALVLAAAAALVAGGMIWVKLAQQPAALAAVDPLTTLSVFDRPQGSADVVADDDLAGMLIEPSSTRLIAQTEDTRYYAGVSRTHLLCVLTLTTGELPESGCTSTDGGTVNLTIGDELLVENTGAPVADGWREAGPQVYLKN